MLYSLNIKILLYYTIFQLLELSMCMKKENKKRGGAVISYCDMKQKQNTDIYFGLLWSIVLPILLEYCSNNKHMYI